MFSVDSLAFCLTIAIRELGGVTEATLAGRSIKGRFAASRTRVRLAPAHIWRESERYMSKAERTGQNKTQLICL
jgi:hypothetical protein